MDAKEIQEKIDILQKEVSTVIKGKDEVIRKVIMAILASGHVLLEDVPGLGKTTLAKAFSKALGFANKRIQFTPDTMPSDIVGMSIYNEQTNAFEYVEGAAVNCNLLLGDEINRTSSKTQSALLEAMAEGCVTVDGVTHQLLEPFVVMATQNPVTSGGTQALPDSQLDRFMICLSMGYPDAESQLAILKNVSDRDLIEKVQPVMTIEDVKQAKSYVKNMQVNDEILRYIICLCEKTREHEHVELGISPRGVGALAEMAKAFALCEGRTYVVPDDVLAIFPDVCAHRLILNTKARRENVTAYEILEEIAQQTEKPKLLRK
jgi:MoxR-like ATPase